MADVSTAKPPANQVIWNDYESGLEFEGNFFDTPGQEALHFLRTPAYPNTHIVLFAFDMTNRMSLNNLDFWRKEFMEHEPNPKAIIVVGTKADLYLEKKEAGEDVLSYDDMFKKAVELGAHAVVMTSAKSGSGVMEDHTDLGICDPDDFASKFSFGDQNLKEQFLKRVILKFAAMDNQGVPIKKLELPPPPESKPETEPKPNGQDQPGCCTLL